MFRFEVFVPVLIFICTYIFYYINVHTCSTNYINNSVIFIFLFTCVYFIYIRQSFVSLFPGPHSFTLWGFCKTTLPIKSKMPHSFDSRQFIIKGSTNVGQWIHSSFMVWLLVIKYYNNSELLSSWAAIPSGACWKGI